MCEAAAGGEGFSGLRSVGSPRQRGGPFEGLKERGLVTTSVVRVTGWERGWRQPRAELVTRSMSESHEAKGLRQ